MITTSRQLPPPSAAGWSINIAGLGGPQFVVLTRDEQDARERLLAHLEELGKLGSDGIDASAIARLPVELVAVIW